ncbi:NADH-ubiquinone oxidoreductase-F iron-sulfur binding region domain-containing protein [Thauera humireducens]|uniref:NADH-ubiquinone oxidoreductase-F iron-sulfur binding region domain-containing protein n=1 Tax=Thauera humireducens TaxID=1134435 RepID=UPI00311E16FD
MTANIMGRTICALGDAASMPVQSFVKHFGAEFEYHIENKSASCRRKCSARAVKST